MKGKIFPRHVLTIIALTFCAWALGLVFNGSLSAKNTAHQLPPEASTQAEAHTSVHFDVSVPLREMPPEPLSERGHRFMHEERMPKPKKVVTPGEVAG